MNDELTAVDIKKMEEEIRYRQLELRPKILEDVKTAKVIGSDSRPDEIGLFDKVVIYIEEDDEEQTIELVTTLRQNALKGLISKESPVGKAVMGHKAGDRVLVQVNDSYSYYIQIRSVEKGADDDSLPISSY